MNAHATGVEVALWPTSRERVVKLLGRYPQVSKNENWEILEFMKNGRHLDIGLLTSDQSLKANLDVFMEDHQKRSERASEKRRRSSA